MQPSQFTIPRRDQDRSVKTWRKIPNNIDLWVVGVVEDDEPFAIVFSLCKEFDGAFVRHFLVAYTQ